MADEVFDPRLDTLLRDVLRVEAARLPVTIRPEQILERRAMRQPLGLLHMPRLIPTTPRLGVVRLVLVVLAIGLLAAATVVGANLVLRTVSPTPTPTPTPTVALAPGFMWPQSTLEEVRQAQERADAGDPDYTWQVDPALYSASCADYLASGSGEIAARYIREEIGWNEFRTNPVEEISCNPDGGTITDVFYIRCAPDTTNSPNPTDEIRGACAPTIDEIWYESVALELSQPVERGPNKIWVVSRSATQPQFARSGSNVAEADVRALLERFLAARIAGRGAEGIVGASSPGIDVPLLYATTSGASYERYEIERFGGAYWAYDGMHFVIRLFADGGKTVVEQLATFNNHGAGDMWLELDEHSTTENGATLVPVPVKHFFFDGQVSMAAPYPWSYDGDFAHYYGLSRQDRSVELIEPMFNPLPVAEGCATGAEPANAQALAQAIGANRDLLTSTPVAVTLNGHAALTIDITLAPGASSCEQGTYVLTRELCCGQRGVTIAQGSRMRLYLVDAPAGSSLGVIAIAIVAPEWRFESVLEAAVPIVETLEFHAPLGQ